MENREIKFRAWDKEFGSMVHEFNEGYFISMQNGELKAGSNDGNEDYFELEIMQFTGLKDKNGKEIYEGDILRCWNGLMPVVFHLGMFMLKGQKREYFSMGYEREIDIEVIGNIHEHPHLIK